MPTHRINNRAMAECAQGVTSVKLVALSKEKYFFARDQILSVSVYLSLPLSLCLFQPAIFFDVSLGFKCSHERGKSRMQWTCLLPRRGSLSGNVMHGYTHGNRRTRIDKRGYCSLLHGTLNKVSTIALNEIWKHNIQSWNRLFRP